MKIALIQSELVWENAQANRLYFENKILEIHENIDLIVLPEMFTTGFSMNPKPIAEAMDGETVLWMQKMASQKKCAIAGSIIIKVDDLYFNRFLFVHDCGTVDYYDKRHLFSLAGEHHEYTAGREQRIVEYRGFKICVLICYDLRFPVFARNTTNYDLLIYVANWPKPRIGAWDALLKARAIENMSFCVGVNRVGQDENQNHYCGHTQAVDFMGQYLLEPQVNAGVFIVNLSRKLMLETREKFGFLNDRDPFELL